MLDMIDLDTRGELLKKCSEKDVKQLLIDFYFRGKKLSKINTDYNLNETIYKIKQAFPYLANGKLCKYDQNKMLCKLPSKEYFKRFDAQINIFKCEKCDHFESNECMCENCRKNYRLEIKKICSNKEKIDLNTLVLEDRILLATFLQYCHVDSLRKDIGTFNEFYDDEFPAFFDETKYLEKLASKNIITISPNSDIDAFVMEEGLISAYYIGKVKWNVNVSTETIDTKYLLEFLKYPNYSLVTDSHDVNFMWREIVIYELIRLCKREMEEFKFNKINDEEDKLYDLFVRLSEWLSPAQIYSLIWFSVRRADNQRTNNTWGNYKFHQVEFIIKNIEETAIQRHQKGKILDNYEYPYKTNKTLLTKIFFEQLLQKPDWFDTRIPSLEERKINKKIIFYENLKHKEKVNFNEDDVNVGYYYLTKFGIVIYDGNVKKLFSNEETLYKISKFIDKTDDIVDKDDEFYSNLDIPFYIEEVYSLSYLMGMIIFLEQNNCCYYLPEEDEKEILWIEEKLSM